MTTNLDNTPTVPNEEFFAQLLELHKQYLEVLPDSDNGNALFRYLPIDYRSSVTVMLEATKGVTLVYYFLYSHGVKYLGALTIDNRTTEVNTLVNPTTIEGDVLLHTIDNIADRFVFEALQSIQVGLLNADALNAGQTLLMANQAVKLELVTDGPEYFVDRVNTTSTKQFVIAGYTEENRYMRYCILTVDEHLKLVRVELLDLSKKNKTYKGQHGILDIKYSREYTYDKLPKKYNQMLVIAHALLQQ